MELKHCVKVSYDDGCYILDGCLAKQQSVLAFTTSGQVIRCYDSQTTTHLFELKDHTNPITDLVTSPSHSDLLFSCQDNTGVMVSDLRQGRAVHFLTEMIASGMKSCSLSVSDDGNTLALGSDGDIQLIDTRTWTSIKAISQLHTDEITRIRFCSGSLCCSAGEDQLINVLDVAQPDEDDMMLNIINWGEVVVKMNYFANGSTAGGGNGVVTLVGSCEDALLMPLAEGVHEQRIMRPDFNTYQVDFVPWQHGELGLVSGVKDDDGNAGPLHVTGYPGGSSVGTLANAHKEIVRVALSHQESTIITGGEDGMIAYWSPARQQQQQQQQQQQTSAVDDDESDKSSNMSGKERVKRDTTTRSRGKPY